jgi:hypothetical protein
MYIQFIFILIAICILTLSITKYKEGQCVKVGSPEAKRLTIRTNKINKRITDQTEDLTKISSRVNKILLNYSNFKFSIVDVKVDSGTKLTNLEIDKPSNTDESKTTGINPGLIFTLIPSPDGDKGDMGNQGLPGERGIDGDSSANGLPGYWGQKGGCSI